MAERLQSRFPGVEFIGGMSLGTVIGDVSIAPGARIDLSQGVRLGGQSIVGRDAIIEGGCIQGSTIDGRESGGRIEDSHVGVFARISGGTLRRCKIQGHGQVRNGCILQDTTVTDNAQVSGGQIRDSEISGNSRVTGGYLVRSIVTDDAVVTGGKACDSLICSHGHLRHGRIMEGRIDGNPLSLHPTRRAEKLPYQESSIPRAQPFSGAATNILPVQNCQPPTVLVDPVTGHLILQAVCTPDGETYDLSTIRRLPATRRQGYRNRAVQDVVTDGDTLPPPVT